MFDRTAFFLQFGYTQPARVAELADALDLGPLQSHSRSYSSMTG